MEKDLSIDRVPLFMDYSINCRVYKFITDFLCGVDIGEINILESMFTLTLNLGFIFYFFKFKRFFSNKLLDCLCVF